MLHWTRERNRKTGTDAAEEFIRQARSIEERNPKKQPFQAARFHTPQAGKEARQEEPASELVVKE